MREMQLSAETLSFQTRFRGLLHAQPQGDRLALDLPAVEYEPHTVEAGLEAALGARVVSAARPCDEPWQVLYELDSETSVRTLAPNIAALAAIAEHCVIVTADADKFDFVSRMFAPHYDVPEDPVTGSAHCLLTPFWSDRLAKQHLLAHQSSARGGTLWCERREDRISLSGHAMTFAKGEITASL
jgi:predicted PhzF superfamily epimerase YddE/YHI9